MRGVVDRIEGGVAVIELGDTGELVNIHFGDVSVSEGDVVEVSDGRILFVDKSETDKRKNEARLLLNKLFNKNK